MKDTANRATQIRSSFEHSRDLVRRAHERAEQAAERARKMRAELRHRQDTSGDRTSNRDALCLIEAHGDQAASESRRFITVVSHELRQPLSAAIGAMAVLENDSAGAATDRARMVLRRQLLHMSALLDDLLDMSRLTLMRLRVQRERLDLCRVIKDAIEAVAISAEQSGLHLSADLPGSAVPIVGDASRLQQAFSNLLSNAVRYTPPAGSVNVSMAVSGQVAVITIVDSGQGILPPDLENIFEPFWRGTGSTAEGFGIGLALVRGIIELHGGSIAAFSEGRNTGARFCLTLPLSP